MLQLLRGYLVFALFCQHSLTQAWPISYEEDSDCKCGIFEFPWVFCGVQAFECGDYCTSGQDVNTARCRAGAVCSISTGDGKGRCECPSGCTDDYQRRKSRNDQYRLEQCNPGPCRESFGPDWSCVMLAGERILQYYGDDIDDINHYSTRYIDRVYSMGIWIDHDDDSVGIRAIKTFDGIDLDGDEVAELAQVCDESAEYVGDQKYNFSENCFVCMIGYFPYTTIAPTVQNDTSTAYPTASAFLTGSPTALDNPYNNTDNNNNTENLTVEP